MKYKEYKSMVKSDERINKLNHNVDDGVYYVYRITDTLNGNHYYGYRKQKKDDIMIDLKDYSSSSKMKKYIKSNPNEFKFKVVRQFDNSAEAIIFESFLHAQFDVKNHTSFINESNQTPFGFDTTGKEPWNKGKTGLGGYKHTNERSPWSEEHKLKLSNKMKGHKKSNTKNYKNVSKDKVVVVDKETGKKIKIDKDKWDKDRYESISKNMVTVFNLVSNKSLRVSLDDYNKNKFLVANGSKWFYKYKQNIYRKSDLYDLMVSENIVCSIQTFIKRLEKLNQIEYIRILLS